MRLYGLTSEKGFVCALQLLFTFKSITNFDNCFTLTRWSSADFYLQVLCTTGGFSKENRNPERTPNTREKPVLLLLKLLGVVLHFEGLRGHGTVTSPLSTLVINRILFFAKSIVNVLITRAQSLTSNCSFFLKSTLGGETAATN